MPYMNNSACVKHLSSSSSAYCDLVTEILVCSGLTQSGKDSRMVLGISLFLIPESVLSSLPGIFYENSNVDTKTPGAIFMKIIYHLVCQRA
jgi:hypothetical protein